ncbi:MAG: adenylate/guanylate cyclase domain-containing protein [Blastochloris sp.]|nr:adenylate/guanylate cyclase domain-containing protein [Blastochloris sp.]
MKLSIPVKFRAQLITVGLCLFSGVLWIFLWTQSKESKAGDFLFKLEQAEWQMQDWVVRTGPKAAIAQELVFLGVDQPNYEFLYSDEEAAQFPALAHMRQSYPWSREVWAEVTTRLTQAGAKAIVFDILFSSPSRDDAAFAAAIHKAGDRAVLGVNLIQKGGIDTIISPSPTLTDSQPEPHNLFGLVNFFPDPDDVVRRANYRVPLLVRSYDSLAKRAISKVDPEAADLLPEGPQRFRFTGPPKTYDYYPIYQIFIPKMWETTFKSGAFFKDKIVMIGPAGNWTNDTHVTPYPDKMLGPELHLHAIAAGLSHDFIKETALWQEILLISAGALSILLFFLFVQNPSLRFGSTLLFGIAYVFLVRFVYSNSSLLLIFVPPLLALSTAATLSMIQSFSATLLEKIRTRSMLERYVSQNFVKEILDHSGDFEQSLGGVRKKCTMLFSDIRGFTTMTESADSQSLVIQLNEYLSQMVECVFRNHGTLDKFIGDAVMAVWGNVQTREEKQDAIDAVHTALEMLIELRALNAAWPARGFTPLNIGIGINQGEVVVGNMGSPRRKEFTVIGDPVNLASRLEGVTKEYGLELVVGHSVADLVRNDFHILSVDLIRVKGKIKPVEVFTILGKKSDQVNEKKRKILETYETAVALYRKLDFIQAQEHFSSCLEDPATGILAKLYLKRCQALILDAPDPALWDGVYEMKTK